MSNPSFDQAFQLLSITREAGISLEDLQTLYSTGLLSDLLKAENLTEVDREAFRKILGFYPSSFRVKMGVPETTDEITAHLKVDGGFGLVDALINQENFPLTAKETPEEEEIVIYDPSVDFTEEEGLAILKREGLMRPTYEHALRFAREHGIVKRSKKKPFFVFLHEPWQDPSGHRCVIVVGGYRAVDYLMSLDYLGRGFNDRCVLAGIRPRK